MSSQALLVSRDPSVLEEMRSLLEGEGMTVQVSADVRQACVLLEESKFDAVIVDCDDLLGLEVLVRLRCSPSSRRAMAFALLNGITSLETAFSLGANFVLDKPLCPELAARSVRAARGILLRERRRYLRHPVDLSASLTLPEGNSLYGRVTNLSEEGMAVELLVAIPPGTWVQVRFDLPGSTTTVEARGEVDWYQDGMAGIRFIEILQMSKLNYQRWLAEHMPENPGPGVFINATRRNA